jgi:hypothetical protein
MSEWVRLRENQGPKDVGWRLDTLPPYFMRVISSPGTGKVVYVHGPHLYRVVDLYQVLRVTRSLPPKALAHHQSKPSQGATVTLNPWVR